MEQYELEIEKRHLKATIDIAREQLKKAAKDSQAYADAIRAIQEERMEKSPLDMGGMHGTQGFSEMLEASSDAFVLSQAAVTQADAEYDMRILARMMDSPYFARIDFRMADGETRPVYIGRATLMEKDTLTIHVYDWRVPIASVFYQYGVGPAQYEAPAGTIHGEVLLKRQFEVRRGELLYYFDADEHVLDNFLRELLSKPAAPAMKSIVETIQRDQDKIIRDMQADLLMVQGTAGSGKTSVALHRVAYLMYQGLQAKRLSPSDILILAPNATFERYISQVLPDLGEKQVQTMLFENLLAGLLPGARIEPRGAWIERWLLQEDVVRKERMRRIRSFKGSRAFIALLARLVEELPRGWIPFADVDYEGKRVSRADLSRVSVCNAKQSAPLGKRLRALEKEIWRRIHALRPGRQEKLLRFVERYPEHAMESQAFARMLSIRESGRLRAQIRAFTRVDCVGIYRALIASQGAFARLSRGLLPPEEVEAIRLSTATRLEATNLEMAYEDAIAIAYLQARIEEGRAYAHLRQVVVDEAQDLDILHAALMNLLFPNARFTFLGDVHQTLAGRADPSFYAEIESALGKPNSLLVTLDKSFRCTREIWAFSARFLPPGMAGACFSRSGEEPIIHSVTDEGTLFALLEEQARGCREKGCESIALLCKTQRDAQLLYEKLKDRFNVSLLGHNGSAHGGEWIIASLFMAKGLEFDAVFIWDADASRYREEADQQLLYIGCTRALHILQLFHLGERSPLLPADGEGMQ